MIRAAMKYWQVLKAKQTLKYLWQMVVEQIEYLIDELRPAPHYKRPLSDEEREKLSEKLLDRVARSIDMEAVMNDMGKIIPACCHISDEDLHNYAWGNYDEVCEKDHIDNCDSCLEVVCHLRSKPKDLIWHSEFNRLQFSLEGKYPMFCRIQRTSHFLMEFILTLWYLPEVMEGAKARV